MPYIGNQHNVGDHVNNFKVLDDISSHTATFDGSATSVVSTTNNTIRVPLHRFIQGQRVTYTHGGGGNIGGLTSGTAYFVSFDSANTIKLATSLANANSNTVINLSAVGSGTSHTLNAAFDGVNKKFKMTYSSGKAARLNNATQLNVAINNVIQRPNIDSNNFTDGFALEDNHKIVFKVAPTVNDVFWGSIIANTIENFDLRDNEVDNFTGDGTTTEFSLSTIPANNESVIVSINGVVQHPSDKNNARSYTLINSIIQFTAAPALNDEIQVRHIGFAGASTNDVSGFYGRTGNVALTSSDHITTGDITARNFKATGITTFSGAVSTGAITATTGTFSGNVSIGGTLTYEDVTNIDSVGIITARSSIYVADSIIHQGDTDTKIDFANNQLKLSAANRLRVDLSANHFNYFYGSNLSEASSTYPKAGSATYVHRFRDTSGDDTVIHFHNTNVKNTVFEWNAYGNTSAAGNLIFRDLNTGKTEYARFTGTGSFNIAKDLDVDGHTNLDNVSIAGVTTFSDAVNIVQGKKINFGVINGTQGHIYFDGSTTRFQTNHGLNIGAPVVSLKSSNLGEVMLDAVHNGAVKLYYDYSTHNTPKLETTATGVTIDGTAVAGGLDISGDIDVDGHTNLDNVNIAGVTTFTGQARFNGEIVAGTVISVQSGGSINIPDKLIHSGDTDTAIRFPSNDTISFETAGSERLRITSDGNITFGIQNTVSAVTSSPIKYISGGRDYWNGTKGDYRALRFRVYDNGGNIDDQYGIGISNGQLEIQSTGSIGFYANSAGSGTGRRVHAMTIDNQRRFSIGLDSVRTNFFNAASTHVPRFQIESTNNDNGRAAVGLVYGKSNASGPYVVMAKHRSNTVGANTVVQSGDETGLISFQGSDGSEFLESARISSFVDGTPGSNDMPGRLAFLTTPDGSPTPVERLRITSAGFVQIGAAADAAEAPLHVTAENSQGINAIFGAKDFVVHNNYNYDDANIALQGRDADDNDTGAGIQFTVRNTANTNWLHGAITMDVSGNYIFKNGGAGTTVGTERFRIATDGSSYFGPQIITEDNLRWGHDANQRPYVFSGATGGNPADASIIAANPNTDPSGTRLGGFGFGCATSSASGVSNSGLKAIIEGLTNNNVSDAWKTGARIRFMVRPDNGNLGEVFSCNSDGTIDQIANLTSNYSLLRLKNARTRASGNKYGIEFRDNINEANANIVIQQNSSGNNAAHMSFYINGGTGGNGLENGNHTLKLKQGGGVEIPTGNLEFRSLSSSTSQSSPASINLGGTYSNAAGNGTNLNAKLKVWSEGTEMMGMSVSSNQLDFILTQGDYDYVWYAGNSGTTEMMRLRGDGDLTLTNGNKFNINAASAAGQYGALLNIGWDQGTNIETRAIDIGGGWSTGENKRITFSHSTGANNLVGEINSIHYGGTPSRTSPHSGLRFGKLYHNGDSTTFTMSLDSTSATTADLNLKGAYRSTKHPAFCAAASGNSSNLGSLSKLSYAISGTGTANNDGFDTTNNRFVAPVDGFYHFYARHWFTPGYTGTAWLYFFRNGSQVKECRLSLGASAGEYNTMQLSTTLYLSATNFIEVYAQASGSQQFHPSNGSFHTEFSGYLVC